MKSLGIIRRISYLLPMHILKNLYFSLIYPYLTYCNLIWTSTYTTHLKQLQILQKKAVRLITRSPYNSHSKPLFLELNLLTIDQVRHLQTCELMHRYHNNQPPPAFSSFFKPLSLAIQTRSNRSYECDFARTNTRKFSIRYQGPLAWNNLPNYIRTVSGLPYFKRLIRAYILTL